MTDEWTLKTLEAYISSKIDALDRFCVTSFAQSKERVDMALAASDKAITKAELATERRFDSVNEFRATLSDQASTFIPRQEFSIQQKSIEERLNMLHNQITELEAHSKGRSDAISTTTAVGLAICAAIAWLITTAVAFFVHH